MNIHNDETFEQKASDMIIMNQMGKEMYNGSLSHTALFLEIA